MPRNVRRHNTLRAMLLRVLNWLFFEPRHFWMALAVPAAAVMAATVIVQSEPAIRLAGLGLQLLGILTAVWGITETWKYFELGDPLKRLKDWFRRCPLRRLPLISVSMTATDENDALAARGHTWWDPKPQAPLEERLQLLEGNIPLLNERITNTQRELDAAVTRLHQQVSQATITSDDATQQLSTKLEKFGTDSLHISAIGAFWLFVGSVLGSAIQEILRLLQ